MVAAALTSCEKDQNMNNPFFEDWTLPHGAVPFDQIKTEHYKPAILKAIEEEDQEIDAIANNPEAPTFANTVEALEYTGQLLEKVGGVFYNMLECDGTDDMLALAEEMQPIYSQHQLNIALNEKLFERVETVWN
jgi:peptidyl-dipeptidase Dcp